MKPNPTSLLQPLHISGKGVILCNSNNAAGQKVKKAANHGTTNNVSGTSLTDYLGGYQYNNGVLQFFPHAQGYVKHTVNPSNGASEFDYVYQYKDHLGNIRINYTFDTATSSLRVLEENHYYPFGLKHQENLQTRSIRFAPSTFASNEWIKGVGFFEQPPMAVLVQNSGYQYKYNGKEYQDELGLNLYDYGWRNYDPAIARWVNVDPLVEQTMMPYQFCSNNPINRIDPNGLTDYKVNGETRTINDGHDNVSIKVTEREFNRLQKKFDKGGSGYERMMNRLSDKNGFTTFNSVADGGGSVLNSVEATFHKPGSGTYGQWSIGENNKIYAAVEHFARVADSGFGAVTDQFGNINLGTNGKMYFRKDGTIFRPYSGRIFNGNQFVSTTSAASKYSGLVKGAKWGGIATGVALGGYEIYQGYQQDGGHYGYNAQVQTAGAIVGLAGGLGGAKLGAALGASVGVWFGGVGAVPGAVIGGLIGGAVCAWGGDFYGEQFAKSVIK
jgi:RHS repeat-associated protein